MDRYKEQCKKIAEQVNPDEEFVKNLKDNLNKRIIEEKAKRKKYLSKVAIIFCTITLVSTGVFAGSIGNWLSQIFSNTDEGVQVAVENGYIQNVDMDYVEHEGIGIKVNSLLIGDNTMDIVFDIKGDIDGEIGMESMHIYINDQIKKDVDIFEDLNTYYEKQIISMDKNHCLVLFKLSNIKEDISYLNELYIVWDSLHIIGLNDKIKKINEKWKFSVPIDEDNFNYEKISDYHYAIKENPYVEDYKIEITNTGMNIQLNLKKEFNKYDLIDGKNIILKTDNQEYTCKDFIRGSNNLLKMNIPITIYDNVDKFQIILNLNNEKITLDVEKQNN